MSTFDPQAAASSLATGALVLYLAWFDLRRRIKARGADAPPREEPGLLDAARGIRQLVEQNALLRDQAVQAEEKHQEELGTLKLRVAQLEATVDARDARTARLEEWITDLTVTVDDRDRTIATLRDQLQALRQRAPVLREDGGDAGN